MSKAIHQGPEKVKEILADFPFLKGKKAEEEVHDGHGFTIQKLKQNDINLKLLFYSQLYLLSQMKYQLEEQDHCMSVVCLERANLPRKF